MPRKQPSSNLAPLMQRRSSARLDRPACARGRTAPPRQKPWPGKSSSMTYCINGGQFDPVCVSSRTVRCTPMGAGVRADTVTKPRKLSAPAFHCAGMFSGWVFSRFRSAPTTRAEGPHGGVPHRTRGEPNETELTIRMPTRIISPLFHRPRPRPHPRLSTKKTKKSGNVFRVGILLDFISSSARTMHPRVGPQYVQASGRATSN